MNDTSNTESPAFWPEMAGPRLPRIALMGEFSAGKSTLANLVIGTNALPVQVMATQLPPVWVTYGPQACVIVDLAGTKMPCDLEDLRGMSFENVAYIKLCCEEKVLKNFDLIDLPGISDPNMASSVWERMLPFADAVVWCSAATQAWRQSEAAVWDTVAPKIQDNSILLLTRSDMLLTEQDKTKVLKRVKSEAEARFSEILMMSLTQARDAQSRQELWRSSGADQFVRTFLALVARLEAKLEDAPLPLTAKDTPATGAEDTCVPQKTAAVLPSAPQIRRAAAQEHQIDADPLSFTPKFS